jgi:hypothetical protein
MIRRRAVAAEISETHARANIVMRDAKTKILHNSLSSFDENSKQKILRGAVHPLGYRTPKKFRKMTT